MSCTDLPTRLVRLPSLPITDIKEAPLSKKLRKFRNPALTLPQGSGVFLTTNEVRTRQIAERLLETPPVPHACHIGFSAWHNFDIMALRKPEYGIICDYNPASTFFMQETLEILRTSTSRHDFVAQITQLIEAHEKACYMDSFHPVRKTEKVFGILFSPNVIDSEDTYKGCVTVADELRVELTRQGSWLSTDENFQRIQTMAKKDNIVCLTEDICASETFQKMRSLLNDNGVQIDSLYLSNIAGCVENREAFKQTVQALTEEDTHVVIAKTPLIGSDLEQRFVEGATLKKEDTNLDPIFWPPPLPTSEQVLQRLKDLKIPPS